MQVGNLFYGWWFKFYIRKNEVLLATIRITENFVYCGEILGEKCTPILGV
jgi:hypothetical protein